MDNTNNAIRLIPCADGTFAIRVDGSPTWGRGDMSARIRAAGLSTFLGWDPTDAADRAEVERRTVAALGPVSITWG